jgi:GTPase SAR1 family protein
MTDFGKVAAEEDPVLNYFLTTEAYRSIAHGDHLVVLGRKGAGKTALVRAFTERQTGNVISKSLNFRSYPWSVHGKRLDAGASPVEAYTASWEFFIAVQLSSLVLERQLAHKSKTAKKLEGFLKANYGSISADAGDILLPDRLKIEGTLEPEVLGCKLGKLDFNRPSGDHRLGRELSALSGAILDGVAEIASDELGGHVILLHFDELDHGLSSLDDNRAQMFIGLVLAGRQVKRRFENKQPRVSPVIYLRTDIWEDLRFSDKNKITETQTITIEWTRDELRSLVEKRAQVKLDQKLTWRSLEDGDSMRGSQQKWDHILARTYMRPRDVIKFCNSALAQLKARQPSHPTVFTNSDISGARSEYSTYLKKELDDEIGPHWADWATALDTLSAMQTITFNVADFVKYYESRRSRDSRSGRDALEKLFQFSIIGYQQPSAGGGSSWEFRYERSGARWDPGASRCKVHPGLKEYCKLREERKASGATFPYDIEFSDVAFEEFDEDDK